MQIHAFAALKPKAPLIPFTYDLPPLSPHEILVQVSHCGLCHSDIHLIDDDWKRSIYPLVPGHEIIGKVAQKGNEASLEIGDRVGVSWIKSTCLSCPLCNTEDTNMCLTKTTICNGHFGGFGEYVLADSRFSYPIPSTLDSAHAAPLLCAGATVYTPLCKLRPGSSVAILGIGGLGHLALQFAAALGVTVTAISSTPSKEEEAKSLGADQFLTLDQCRPHQFDLILSTVSADLNWNHILTLLKPKGTLHFLGRPASVANIDVSHLISPQRTISGSSTANRAMMKEMLEFAAEKGIKPQIEMMPLERVNEAIERLRANQVRYRIVLEI